MSKSKGNAVDPFDALEKYGADAIRWYFYINSAPWLPNRFHGKAVMEGQRKFMGTLWNTYAFFVLYANIDNFDATKYALDYEKLPVMDKWLLSKLNSTVKEVDDDLANYRIPEAARALQDFVDDMSNWYVRRSRERFWAKGMEQDKINAYMTLYTALVTISKTAAPMVPFMTEEIYQNLVRSIDETAPESIHLCDFPQVEEGFIDKELEAKMDEVLKVVVMGRAARNTANIKNRQPIAKMFVKAEALPEYYQEIIEDELNVKAVEFTDDVRAFTSYTFKPQLKTVGPKYGKQLGNIRKALTELDGNAAMDTLNEKGALAFNFDGAEVVLTREDLLIDMAQTEGYVSEGDNTVTVVPGYQPDSGACGGRLLPGAGEQDPDHEKRSRLRGHGPYLRVRRQQRYHHRHHQEICRPVKERGAGRQHHPGTDGRPRQGVEHQRRDCHAGRCKGNKIIRNRRT